MSTHIYDRTPLATEERDGLLSKEDFTKLQCLNCGDEPTPPEIPEHCWDSISIGNTHTLAIRNGQLYAWGNNGSGQLGLGDFGSGTHRNTPTLVEGFSDWESVSAGSDHTLAIRGGQLYAWGRNNYGQLGLGDTDDRNTPTLVEGFNDWDEVHAYEYRTYAYSIALRQGRIYGWGNVGSSYPSVLNSSLVPTEVQGFTDWEQVTLGFDRALALRNGQLYAWGHNADGQLGLGDTTSRNTPTLVEGFSDWTSVSAGSTHTLAIRGGQLYAWGKNNGQLGLDLPPGPPILIPTLVEGISDWTSVSAGFEHTFAIRNGQLYAWGKNNGQLGLDLPPGPPILIPTLVEGISGLENVFTNTFEGGITSAFIKGGNIYIWGYNDLGQLGLGDTDTRATPTEFPKYDFLPECPIITPPEPELRWIKTDLDSECLDGVHKDLWLGVNPTTGEFIKTEYRIDSNITECKPED